jgi:hypothetical protein
MNRNPLVVSVCAGLALLAIIALFTLSPRERDHLQAIDETIDAFHQAAADADLETYFGLLTEDARFLGTDVTERWTKSEFLAYATERGAFDEAPAWVYTPTARHIDLGPAARTAWFDEVLAHDRYGTLRGSGVLTRSTGTDWKIAQYNLTFLVPNDRAAAVMEAISPPLPEGEGPGERESE